MSAVLRCRFRTPRRDADTTPIGDTKAAARQPVSRISRMLALAHHVERLINAGELTGYAEAARALGLTRARLTQVMNLMLLAPEIQEQVLVADLPATERQLRRVVARPDWNDQLAI